MTCYSSLVGTRTFTKLPGYVSYIQGYSPTNGKVYFKDSSGVDLVSANGIRMEILVNGTMDGVTDIVLPTVIPGNVSPMSPIATGPYTSDFLGISYAGSQFVSWASCCVP
jgi:hypothetical protein